jgi:hypothetical protein
MMIKFDIKNNFFFLLNDEIERKNKKNRDQTGKNNIP